VGKPFGFGNTILSNSKKAEKLLSDHQLLAFSFSNSSVFEYAGDKEIGEGIFVDEELQSFDGDEDEPLLPSISPHEPVPASTLEAEARQATASSTAVVEVSRVKGEIIFEHETPSHIYKAHPPQ
jgi:hypothetical protein